MKNSFMHRYAVIMVLLFADIIWLSATGFLSLWIRFDFSVPYLMEDFWAEQIRVTPIAVVTFIVIYYIFRLYHSLWRFASVMELARIVCAYIIIIPVVAVEVLFFGIHLPRSVYLITYILDFLGCVGVRFAYRFIRELSRRRFPANVSHGMENVMMIGAGEAARELLSDIAVSDRVHYHAVCVIDDNPDTWNRYIGSVPIVGGRESIVEAAEKYAVDRIIFAIPTATGTERSDILEICRQTHCRLQVIPGMYELLNEDLTVSRLKDVDVTDLLGRDTNILEHQDVLESIAGKVVLVTGGGGSIGSELCRQVALAQPQQLIIFDIYENNAYAIEQELRRKFPELNLVVLIGSVRNTNRVNHVLHTYKPDVIYHAAAHKHVPLMETSPIEAIKNNVFGTYKLARAAARAKTKRFLLISTDKAVNPTNVMGASKRVCELVIQFLSGQYPETTFCAVRFGNVLGSNGSVIPLFREQIKNGGPVTVTDPRIIRYFMTIPEAVSLVLVASYYARGGEVFVLDMGQPVKIDDMARKMIELSGFTPDVDIHIEYTGLRPGEKMYEELLVDKETMRRTENKKIFIEQAAEMDDKQFRQDLTKLGALAKKEDKKAVDLLWDMIGGKFEPTV